MFLEIIILFCIFTILFWFFITKCIKFLYSSYFLKLYNLFETLQPQQTPETPGSSTRSSERRSDETCSICYDSLKYSTETNCAHKFCAECIIQYWKTLEEQNRNSKVNCPLCRQVVYCLLPSLTSSEYHSDDYRQISTNINAFNRKFSKDSLSAYRCLRDAPVLMRHLVSETFSTTDAISILNKIKIVMIALTNLVYIFSPIDLLPEVLFGILGYLDDLVAFLMTISYLTTFYRQLVANRS